MCSGTRKVSRKALFFDIDGTLLSEVTRTVPESAKQAIDTARSQGHLVFVNTGRAYSELGAFKDELKTDGWLCGCGTYIEVEGKTLYHHMIPVEEGRAIKSAIRRFGMEAILEGRDGCYVDGDTARNPRGQAARKGIAFAIRPGDWDRDDWEFDKFCVMADEESDRVGFFRSLSLDIDVIDRGDEFYECVPAGHSKATAIDVVLEHYGLSLKDAYVFGDSTNDLPMFEHVPNAVLMGKHDKELEPYASFNTKTVEQDGIWYAMNRLGLLGGIPVVCRTKRGI